MKNYSITTALKVITQLVATWPPKWATMTTSDLGQLLQVRQFDWVDWINIILTSSTIDKKLEIYIIVSSSAIDKKLENKLEIDKKTPRK